MLFIKELPAYSLELVDYLKIHSSDNLFDEFYHYLSNNLFNKKGKIYGLVHLSNLNGQLLFSSVNLG